MSITGKLYKTNNPIDGLQVELSLLLDKQGIEHLAMVLRRALNTWDGGPRDLFDLSTKLDGIVDSQEFKNATQSV